MAAVGPEVKSLKEGDRVGVPWLHDACGECDFCLTGWETLCTEQHNTGYSVNGCFAEYVVADSAYVGRLPENIDFVSAAPLLCAGVTTYKGLKETEARPGEWVTIVGVGGLGHMAIEYAKAMGMHVAAVDVCEEKLELAAELGAELTVCANADNDPVSLIQDKIGGTHAVLVTAVSPVAFRQSVGMLRRGGTCVLVGLPPGEFPLPIFDVVLKRLTIRGSIVGTRHDLTEALQIAADFKIRPNVETQPLEAVNDVFDRLRRGDVNGRIVFANW